MKLKNFKVLYCEKKSDFYTFGVDLIDKENTKFQMNYVLTYLNEKLTNTEANISFAKFDTLQLKITNIFFDIIEFSVIAKI